MSARARGEGGVRGSGSTTFVACIIHRFQPKYFSAYVTANRNRKVELSLPRDISTRSYSFSISTSLFFSSSFCVLRLQLKKEKGKDGSLSYVIRVRK